MNPWNPNAYCDGVRAEERVLWLQQNEGMTADAARIKVMREFPAALVGGGAVAGPVFNPNAMCDGIRAEERVLWLDYSYNSLKKLTVYLQTDSEEITFIVF